LPGIRLGTERRIPARDAGDWELRAGDSNDVDRRAGDSVSDLALTTKRGGASAQCSSATGRSNLSTAERRVGQVRPQNGSSPTMMQAADRRSDLRNVKLIFLASTVSPTNGLSDHR
jgi:hypothetical protein